MNIALVEDDEDAVRTIREYLGRYEAERGDAPGSGFSLTVFGDGLSFLDGYRPVYDAVFMDIAMPYMDGMKAAERLRETDSDVVLVFITSLKQFALKGYRVDALDFLVKPVSYSSFRTMLYRVEKKAASRPREYLTISNSRGTYRIPVDDIRYLESESHYVVIHASGDDVRLFGTLAEMERRLPEGRFARCNSYYLVNLSRVTRVDSLDVYVGDEVVRMSKGKKEGFMKALFDSMSR